MQIKQKSRYTGRSIFEIVEWGLKYDFHYYLHDIFDNFYRLSGNKRSVD